VNRHVLVPVDGSPKSRAGLEHALTTYPDAEITVLHVMAPYDRWGPEDPPLPTPAAEAWFERAQERATTLLDECRALAAEHGREVTTAVEVGEAWRTIVDYTRAHDVDHVVMGSHGRPDDATVALGSVAETVARRSPVIVSIVR